MLKDWPKVSIIILNWNNYEDTKECLQSLDKITYPNYEIIVVDNGSTDGSGERLKKEFPQHTFLRNERNLGFAGGNNVGIRHALTRQVDYLWLLNNDATVDPTALAEMIKVADSNPKIGMVGAKIYYYDDPKRLWHAGGIICPWEGGARNIGEYELDQGQYDQRRDVDYVAGCSMLIRRQLIEEIGLLDERYFLYLEETDWALRARRSHWRIIYVPSARVWHKVTKSVTSLQQEYYATRNRLLFIAKNYPWLIPFVSVRVLGHIMKRAIKGQGKLSRIALKAYLDFWRREWGHE